MPAIERCGGYPACQFTSDYCRVCAPSAAAFAEKEIDMQTRGTMPQLRSGKGGKKVGGKKKGC